jgi:hypothetical protein
MHGSPQLTQPVACAKDLALAKSLWRLSEEISGVKCEG